MKILINPIKTNIRPIIVSSLLTTGAFTLGAFEDCTTTNFKYQDRNTHYTETITTLNNDLNYLNSAKKNKAIDFGDYYEKSKKVINETALNEEKLKEDNREIEKYKNAFPISFMIVAGLASLAFCQEIMEDKRRLSIPLVACILGLGELGFNHINKDSNEQKYIQEAQQSLQVYKAEKLATLNSLKDEEFNQVLIKTSENK